jgi:hypothetical protein
MQSYAIMSLGFPGGDTYVTTSKKKRTKRKSSLPLDWTSLRDAQYPFQWLLLLFELRLNPTIS